MLVSIVYVPPQAVSSAPMKTSKVFSNTRREMSVPESAMPAPQEMSATILAYDTVPMGILTPKISIAPTHVS